MPDALHGHAPLRRTKIVATLGPASSERVILEQMLRAGVDVVRLNFSHGTAQDHIHRAELVREMCRVTGRTVAIMADLQGPKIRIGRFEQGPIQLAPGDEFTLDAERETGGQDGVGLDYKELPQDVHAGDLLLLDDGRIVFEVLEVSGSRVRCKVVQGGELSNNKGINRRGGGLTAPALTAKDMEDIRTAANMKVDYVAVSFPKSSADMYMARQLLRAARGEAFLIAKIERAEAVAPAALADIMSSSDGIMVARGDLAVEVGDASVPALQKRMIRMARELNKFTITATQMMESMIQAPFRPARKYPMSPTRCSTEPMPSCCPPRPRPAVPAGNDRSHVDRICVGAETRPPRPRMSKHRINESDAARPTRRWPLSAMYAANHLAGLRAIACMTATGCHAADRLADPLGAADCRAGPQPDRPAAHGAIPRRGLAAIRHHRYRPRELPHAHALRLLRDRGIAEPGDHVILTRGDHMNAHGGTNSMKILDLEALT